MRMNLDEMTTCGDGVNDTVPSLLMHADSLCVAQLPFTLSGFGKFQLNETRKPYIYHILLSIYKTRWKLITESHDECQTRHICVSRAWECLPKLLMVKNVIKVNDYEGRICQRPMLVNPQCCTHTHTHTTLETESVASQPCHNTPLSCSFLWAKSGFTPAPKSEIHWSFKSQSPKNASDKIFIYPRSNLKEKFRHKLLRKTSVA